MVKYLNPIPPPASVRGGAPATAPPVSATAPPPPPPPAIDLAAVGASLAQNRQTAEAKLAAAPNARHSELAKDSFDSAQRGLAAPGAAQAIDLFNSVGAANVPGVVAAFGGPVGAPGGIPPQFANREVTTVGRFGQTGPAGDAGSRILRVPDGTWSTDLNALWMQDAVNRGDVIKLATGVSADKSSLTSDPQYGGVSVFTRELSMAQAAGYTRQGDYLIPPR